MNRYLKNILYTLLLLLGFNTAFALLKFNDSIVEKLVAEGSAKFKQLQLENEEHIKNKEYDKLNFIINLGANDNLFNYQYNGEDKFVVTPSVETNLNQRLQQLYINSNSTKQCYLLLISCFDVEVKATPPDGLTIEDVFSSGKFYNENSDIQDAKWLHHNITDQIINSNSIDKSKCFYFVSLGRYRGTFHKNQVGSYHFWFAKKNIPSSQTLPTYFNETYTYLKDYLDNALKNVKGNRENIAVEAVKGFEQAYKNAPLKAQILTTYSSAGLKAILQNFTTADDYLTLTTAERVHILKVFTGESMVFTETYALNVLKNTPTNQQSIILDSLKSVKNEFDDNLISLLSWRMDGENFNGYIETITLWLSKQSTNNVSWKQILQNANRDKRCIIEFSASLLDGYGSTVSYSADNVCFKVTKNFSTPISTTTKCTDVYDKILVKFVSDFDINGRQFKKGDVVLMPSLYAHLLFNKSTNDKLKTVGNVALNTALLTIGIGEIRAASTFYETTIALLDMGVGASDLIIQEGFATTLNQSQEGKDFLNVWNKINLIYGSTRIVSELTGLNTELKNYAQQLKNKSLLTNTEQQKIDEILQKVDEYTGGSNSIRYIANSGSELKTYLENLVSLPAGQPYSGEIYRYKPTGATYNVTDINPNMNPLENRFKTGLYASTSKEGNLIEVNAYGGTSGKTQYEISNVQMNNLLDLTDEATIKQLGTSIEQMKLSGVSNKYEYTHVIADWAKSKGYSGVKFYGAQGSSFVYKNIIVFDQSAVNNSIINSTIDSILW